MTARALYTKSTLPDNHVAPHYMQSIVHESHQATPLAELIQRTGPLVQHVAATLSFAAVFSGLYTDRVAPEGVVVSSIVMLVVTHAFLYIWHLAPTSKRHSPLVHVIPFVTLYLLSPALRSLTLSTTSDSIWAISGILLAASVLFATYGTSTTHNISLAAAVCASIVLASRLDTQLAVFALLLMSYVWFGPFPLVRASLSFRPACVLTALLLLMTLAAVSHVSQTYTPVAVTAIIFMGVCVVLPFTLRVQLRHKHRITGPWVIALPTNGSRVLSS